MSSPGGPLAAAREKKSAGGPALVIVASKAGLRYRKTIATPRDAPTRSETGHTQEHIPMADLKKQFEAAAANSKNLSERPDNATLLKIYALYKQGSNGDNTDKKPGFGDMVGRAKWDAWNALKGTSQEDAMQQYVDLIQSLE
tara:strand:- start:12 stop:437 length:426 start_codon:yes stop_codon:yes gene_type:complete